MKALAAEEYPCPIAYPILSSVSSKPTYVQGMIDIHSINYYRTTG